MPQAKLSPEEVESRWRRQGFSFGVYTDPPGQVWKDFVHETDELLMVSEGEMELEMHGRTVHCEIGKQILIPAKAVHTVRNVGKTTARWFYGYRKGKTP